MTYGVQQEVLAHLACIKEMFLGGVCSIVCKDASFGAECQIAFAVLAAIADAVLRLEPADATSAVTEVLTGKASGKAYGLDHHAFVEHMRHAEIQQQGLNLVRAQVIAYFEGLQCPAGGVLFRFVGHELVLQPAWKEFAELLLPHVAMAPSQLEVLFRSQVQRVGTPTSGAVPFG